MYDFLSRIGLKKKLLISYLLEKTAMSGVKTSNWQVNLTTAKELEEIRQQKLEEIRKRSEADKQRQLEKKRIAQESESKRQLERKELNKEIERQKRLEEEKCQELNKSVSDSIVQLSRVKAEIVSCVADLDSFEEKQIKRNPSVFTIQELKAQVFEQADCFLKAQHDSHNSTATRTTLDQSYKLINELNEVKEQIKEHLHFSTQFSEKYKQLDAEEKLLEGSKHYTINPKKVFNLTSPHKENASNVGKLNQIVEELEALIAPYLMTGLLSDKSEIVALQNAVEEIVGAPQLDDRYKYCQVQMRKKAFLLSKPKYDKAIEKNQKLISETESMQSNYISLCSILDIPPKEELLALNIEYTNSAISRLQEETKHLERVWARRDEAEYISKSVNEIMRELGYVVIATDLINTSKQELYVYDIYGMKDGNAVNVFSSDNGSLLFEVTGISSQKREPSSLEKLKIKESMESFSGQYDIIRKELKSRGIELTKENIKRPDEKLARIVDISNIKANNILAGSRKVRQRAPERKKAYESELF